jgi:hypothetical protein
VPGHLNPSEAAYYAIIAICLVLIGALLTAGPVSIEQRGTVLGAIFAALAYVAWRWRRQHREDDR